MKGNVGLTLTLSSTAQTQLRKILEDSPWRDAPVLFMEVLEQAPFLLLPSSPEETDITSNGRDTNASADTPTA